MSDFDKETAIIVGGAGFVGSNLCKKLLGTSIGKIVIVDNLLSADVSNVPDDARIDFRLGSINEEKILNGLPQNAGYIFHLSTYHGNQSSIADPLADHEHNTLTSLRLFDHIRDWNDVKRVVYASAGCTVAEKTFDKAEATYEDAPVTLYYDSPYQVSKIIGELYGNYYFTRYGMPFVKARFQNVYGPGEILGAGRWRGTPATVWRNVTPTFIYKALNGEALPVDNGGIATRDFIYVEDLVNGLIACALNGAPGEVYNLASGVETSILDLANLVNELADNQTPLDFRPARDWDRSGKRYGSPEKAEKDISFKAGVELRDGLSRTIDWTRDNLATIERCISQHQRFISAA